MRSGRGVGIHKGGMMGKLSIYSRVFLFVAILMFLPVAGVGAATVSYFNRVDFNIALDADSLLNKTVQGWDGIDAGHGIALGEEIDGVTYNAVSVPTIFPFLPSTLNYFVADSSSFSGLIPLSPDNVLARTTAGNGLIPSLTDTIFLTFSEPIKAFGISFLPYSAEVLTVGFGDIDLQAALSDPFPGMGDLGYFVGFISDESVSEVELVVTLGYNYVFDNMIYATQVPLPGAVWLLASGLIGFVAVRRGQLKEA